MSCNKCEQAEARLRALQDALQPGRPEAFVRGMFALAEEYGHSPYSSTHALTFLRQQCERLRAVAGAANALSLTLLHDVNCAFTGCTCDTAALQADRLSELRRQLRLVAHVVQEGG